MSYLYRFQWMQEEKDLLIRQELVSASRNLTPWRAWQMTCGLKEGHKERAWSWENLRTWGRKAKWTSFFSSFDDSSMHWEMSQPFLIKAHSHWQPLSSCTWMPLRLWFFLFFNQNLLIWDFYSHVCSGCSVEAKLPHLVSTSDCRAVQGQTFQHQDGIYKRTRAVMMFLSPQAGLWPISSQSSSAEGHKGITSGTDGSHCGRSSEAGLVLRWGIALSLPCSYLITVEWSPLACPVDGMKWP